MANVEINELSVEHTTLAANDLLAVDVPIGGGEYELRKIKGQNLKLARSRSFHVPYYDNDQDQYLYGVELADGVSRQVTGAFQIPQDYQGTMKVYAIINPAGNTGNMKYWFSVRQGGVGEAYNAHDYTISDQVEAIAAGLNLIGEVSLAQATAGDFVTLGLVRLGGDAADTINAAVYLLGFYVTYTADN